MHSELAALRCELEALTIDYWHEVDSHGGAHAADYYVEDGVYATTVREYRGRAAIDAFYGRRRERGARTSLHLVNNFRVEVDSTTRVRCQYVLSLLAADGAPVLPSRPPILVAIVDEVALRQHDGSWRYASRRIQPCFRDDSTPTTG